eukprot:TRINITY_DN16704_c1_g1_i1.p1 TRINITY_DN16704_c1_g1~~TRINITY_DN16704_c1_g1_i1.p1  ORF type:complete len:341 (+),score=48.70 TRINITY_DN16704_c1_g1_i1:84-1106(+)
MSRLLQYQNVIPVREVADPVARFEADINGYGSSSSSQEVRPKQQRRRMVTRFLTVATVTATSAGLSASSAWQAFSEGSLREVPGPLLRWPPRLLDAGDEWHLCSREGGTCECTGTAALHSMMGDWAMLMHVNGSIRCSEDMFGDDPRQGMLKFCSCRDGLTWPESVADGLNSTIARKLVLRVEAGPAGAGCLEQDDSAWTPCAVMSHRFDASIFPDRLVPRLPPDEQLDMAFRKLDLCHKLAGPEQAIRILGVWPSSIPVGASPMKASGAPICSVVYEPSMGPAWGARAVYCPTDPPRCLEGSCECASESHRPVDLRKRDNSTAAVNATPCYACMPPEAE